ncbi:hypothetical protein ABG768_024542, partial [Culter alburnus]
THNIRNRTSVNHSRLEFIQRLKREAVHLEAGMLFCPRGRKVHLASAEHKHGWNDSNSTKRLPNEDKVS